MNVRPIEQHTQHDVQMEGAVGVKMRMLIGEDDNAPSFHMRHFEIAPVGHTPHHAHDYEHEILVLSGSGVIKSEQGDQPIRKGDVAFVPPDEWHQFVNGGDDPLLFICLVPAPQSSGQ